MHKTLRKRAAQWAMVGLMALGLLKSVGCAMGRNALDREATRYRRDPASGVIAGAESRRLGDPAARQACLLLHGFIGSGGDFNRLPDRLAREGFFVSVPRLPGHGTHPRDLEAETAESLLAAARDEFDRLRADHETVHVVGFSMGGALATLLAAERPVSRLALVAPYYDVSMRWYYVLPPHLWNHALGGMFEFLPKWTPFVCVNKKEAKGQWVSYGAVSSGSVRMVEGLGRRAGQAEVLERITCPVLHLHAVRDRVSSPRAARRALVGMASADKRQYWYKRSNHMLFWDYDAEEAEQRVVEFLR